MAFSIPVNQHEIAGERAQVRMRIRLINGRTDRTDSPRGRFVKFLLEKPRNMPALLDIL